MSTTTMSVALECLRSDPANARRITNGDVADLTGSIGRIELLQPIIVRPDGEAGYWLIVAGNRRAAACRALGHTHVPAIEYAVKDGEQVADYAIAASAAENMVRAPMHPVDTWRAITALIDQGYSREGAADALGVSHPLARRLEHLGGMAPELIDAIAAQPELPSQAAMRTIALAPAAVQQKALSAGRKRDGIDWWRVAQGCETTRIPLARAIFDATEVGVQFDEDLFAQPEDEDRFTTSDIAGFLAAQRSALERKAANSKGRITAMAWSRPMRLRDRMPKGWHGTYDPVPKRWKRDDPRHLYACVIEDGYELGDIEYVVATPKVDRPVSAAALEVEADTVRERQPITKASYDRLAIMKREAVVARLPNVIAMQDPGVMLRALLLVLTFENVALWDSNRRYGSGPYRDLARVLVDADGQPIYRSHAELCGLAAEAIARVVKFDGDNATNSSGSQAEWLAAMLGAEMPRCDTEEILKGVSKDKLIELARQHGVDEQGRVSELRARLVGHLPDWRPVDFGAKGPSGYHFEPETDDEDAEEAA